MSTDAGKEPQINGPWHAAIVWLRQQSTETVLLVGILCVVTYGLYQGFTALKEWIPAHIKSLTEAHQADMKQVLEKDERQREADRQLAERQFDSQQKTIDKLMRINGFAGALEPGIVKRPE